jgi:hypothetical protein
MNLCNLTLCLRDMVKPGYHFKIGEKFGSRFKIIRKTRNNIEVGVHKKILGIIELTDICILPSTRFYRIVEK